jgi:hypothetical protein
MAACADAVGPGTLSGRLRCCKMFSAASVESRMCHDRRAMTCPGRSATYSLPFSHFRIWCRLIQMTRSAQVERVSRDLDALRQRETVLVLPQAGRSVAPYQA